MTITPTSLLRGVVLGILSGGTAFLVVLFLGDNFPAKVHAWFLLAAAGFFAISDSHFKSLLSELGALLRRGTYSVWQLEILGQTVPKLRKQVSFVWALSTWLKAGVGLFCALLLWDGLPLKDRSLAMYGAYALFTYSAFLGFWGRQNFRKLEKEVDAVTAKEAELKEKRRLLQNLQSGDQHDFVKDKLAEGYTKPPIALE